ncbi:lamin tail domain-containing protein [Limisphaera ngatamarikiensis]|uniref:lamin tail domain-containing protein n=1 Tax=Limisphaera ngatamarikiensis TaxID=1324935 RepID=UPI0013ED689A
MFSLIWKLRCCSGLVLLLAWAHVAWAQTTLTLVPEGAWWRWRKGTNEASNPTSAWRQRSYNDSTWLLGPAPFHYGEGLTQGTLLSDMRSNYTCIFLRTSFVFTNAPEEVAQVELQANFDDGFVAWINGVEVARSNVVGEPLVTGVASASHEAGQFESFPIALTPSSYLVTGSNVLAVQVFNSSRTSSDLRWDARLVLRLRVPSTPPAVVNVQPPAGATVSNLSRVVVTFNKPVQGVDGPDLWVQDQPAARVWGVPGTNVYVFEFAPPAPGLVAISWDEAHGITDLAGQPFDATAASAHWTYVVADTVPPVIQRMVPAPGATVGQFGALEVWFSEPVSGVDASDLQVQGRPAAAVVGSGAGPYVFTFEPAGPGTVEVAWSPGHGIADLAQPPNPFAGGSWTVQVSGPGFAGDVILNEFVAANRTGLRDEDGELQDWIELYNRGSNTVNLLGWSLTDDPDDPTKWVFPSVQLGPGQYLVVFASGKDRRDPAPGRRLHLNFQLNDYGEYLALYRPDYPFQPATVFAPAYPEQRTDIAYGLAADGQWRYFATPTPGAANTGAALAGITPEPHASVARGWFDHPFWLHLSCPLPDAVLRYTTDGREPTATTGSVYTGPLWITNTTVLRVAAFAPGYLPSRTVTHTYLFLESVIRQPNNPPGFPSTWGTYANFPNNIVPADYEMDWDPLRVDPNNPASPVDPAKLQDLKEGLLELPVLSLVMNPADLFEPTGLYWSTNVVRKTFPNKPVSVEMVLPDGRTAFATTAGIEAHGNASREPSKNPKHGFKLNFRGDFGPAALEYPVFPESPVKRFDDLVLRPDFNTSWRHWSDSPNNGAGAYQRSRASRFRDAWIKQAFRDMGQVASHNRYVHLFLNGLYWGVYDISEQPTKHFGAAYYGGDDDEYDAYDQGVLRAGTADVYNAMVGLTGLADNARYEQMKQYLDVPQYIDYVLLHFFVGHQDWGYNKNWHAVRPRRPGGTFKFFPWDGECILLNEDVNRVSNTDVPAGLHTKLVENAQYRLDFADRVYKHLLAPGGALTREANIARWLYWSNLLYRPIVAESCRWGDYRRDVHPWQDGTFVLYTRETHWQPENQRMVGSYFVNRPGIVLNQLRAAGLYPGVDPPEFRLGSVTGPVTGGGRVARGTLLVLRNPGASGTVYFTTNGTDPRVYYAGTVSADAQIYTQPIVLQDTLTIKARVLSGTTWSALNEATFRVAELTLPIAITEINYNPPGGEAYEFLELQNRGTRPLDLGGFSFEGISFVFPIGTVLAPGGVIVLANNANPAAFAERYPGVPVFGYFGGNLSNGGERLRLLDRQGRPVLTVAYDDENGWPAAADGGGATLELVDPEGDPSAPASWRASARPWGTPGLAPVAAPSPGPVRISEVMADNAGSVVHEGAFPDWVELHNRGDEPVDLGGWSLTDDSNPRKFVFPSGVMLPPGGFLVVWCDSRTNTAGLHTGFALSRRGDSVFLYDPATNRVDALSFGVQLTDFTLGRVGDEWRLCRPTPGSSNEPVALAPATNLVWNEWLANAPPGGTDWVELYNRDPNAPVSLRGLYVATSNAVVELRWLSFVPPGGFVLLRADSDPGPDSLGLSLPASGGTLTLYDPAGEVLDQVSYTAQPEGVSEGRYPDGAETVVTFPGTPSPGASNYRASWSGPWLNEVLARNNRAALAPWGEYADFIELHNPGSNAVSLAGLALGRGSGTGRNRWAFPPGVSIPGGGYLVVWCDGARPAGFVAGSALNAGFDLDGDSDEVLLFNAAGQVVDRVAYGLQVRDLPLGRTAEGWQLLAAATPGGPNAAPAELGPVTALRINEWLAANPDGPDWFELYNTDPRPVRLDGLRLTDNPSIPGRARFSIPPLSFIAGHGWARFIADNDRSAGAHHVNFALNQRGDSLLLYTADGQLIDAVGFGLQSAGVSQGRLPDGGSNVVAFPGPSAGEPNYLPLTNVLISEVLSHTDPPFEDAVEILNLTDNPLDISGWYLSDSAADPKRYRVPEGTVIPARGYVVFYQFQFGSPDGEADAPPRFSFNSAHGDEVHLFEALPDGTLTGARASAVFGPAPNGIPWGIHPTSVGYDFTLLSQPTFGVSQPTNLVHFRTGRGAPNAAPCIGPVVINEIHYQPPEDLDAPDSGLLEFIELYNLAPTNVPLYDPVHPTNRWRLANAVRFEFPPGLVLPPGGYLLVVAFDPQTNAAALELFRARYGVTTTPIAGPWDGRLDNAGETVELLRPDTPQAPPHPDAGYVPYYPVDRVAYGRAAPWPVEAAGGGASLQRIRPDLYGNDPVHWKAGAPTAGRTNAPVPQAPPVIVQAPRSLTVRPGETATFQVEVEGAAPYEFQWYHGGTPIPGATAPVLTFVVDSEERAGSYRVRVSNAYGTVLSSPATLTVLVPPQIVAAPPDLVVRLGEEILLQVQAAGTAPLSYQWQRNGIDLPGQTASILRVASATLADAGLYRVLVTNEAGSTSAVARVTVQAPPQLTLQPQGGFAVPGSRFEFRAAATGDPPLSYQWHFNDTSIPGATQPVLVLDPVRTDHAGTYTVRVTNPAGSVWSAPAMLIVVQPPRLSPVGWTEEGEFEGLLMGEPGRLYVVEASVDLRQWIEIGRWRVESDAVTFLDAEAGQHPVRYYRARLIE